MNIAQYFDNIAKKNLKKTFIIHEEGGKITRTVTYEEFGEKVQIAAVYLLREGLRFGDRVAIVLPNSAETLELWFAVCAVGGIAAIIEPVLKEDELRAQLEHLEPKLVINQDNYRSFLEPDHRGRVSFYPSRPDHWSAIVYSSGTTGAPKGVMQCHNNYIMTGEGFAHWFKLDAESRLYTCLPFTHVNAQIYSVMGALAANAALIIGSKFNKGKDFWPKIVATEATHINMLGGMLRDLKNGHGLSDERLHKVKTIANGQALPGAEIHRHLESMFSCRIVPTYGASENLFGFVVPLDSDKRGGNCVGKKKTHPAISEKEFEAKIVDADGNEITAPDTAGELFLKNPYKAQYFKDDARNVEKWRDGWYHTGDMFSFDKDGDAVFVGRSDDIIRRGGNLVNPAEIEAALMTHCGVAEAAVVGIKDEFGESSIKAVVALVSEYRQRVTAEELKTHCAERLAPYKVPQLWEIVDELPRNGSERVQKKLLT